MHGVQRVLAKYKDAGVGSVVFGDIFLAGLRKYREIFLTISTLTIII